MNREHIAQLRAKAALLYQHAREWAARVPLKARGVLVLFLVAALRIGRSGLFRQPWISQVLRLCEMLALSAWLDESTTSLRSHKGQE